MKRLFSSKALWAAFAALAVTPAFAVAEEGHSAAADAATRGYNNHSEGWNILWHHVLLDLVILGGIFAAITVWFLLAYGRKSPDQEGNGPSLSVGESLAWGMIPAFLFMADDFYLAAQGWKLWNDQRTVPEDAIEVSGLAGMYFWEFTYENGTVGDQEIVAPVGQPIVIRSTSEDVVHSLFVPDFRIKEDVMPGRVTFIWFAGEEPGDHVFTCAEYCGMGHSNMYGKVRILPQAEFDQWLEENA
jgi:cytochrome c oxidase subunit 2